MRISKAFKNALIITLSILLICSLSLFVGLFNSNTKASASGLWDGSPSDTNANTLAGLSNKFERGTGTVDDPYQIANGKQLANMAVLVNNGITDNTNVVYENEVKLLYSQKSYELIDDILLNNWVDNGDNIVQQNEIKNNATNLKTPAEWTPIGTVANFGSPSGETTNTFKGTFNGNNHTVSGVYITKSTAYQGLFGAIYGATIENVKVNNSYLSVSNYACGILVGLSNTNNSIVPITINNCETHGTINASLSSTPGIENTWYGGIAGYSGCTTIDGCVSNVTITSSANSVGGITGCVQNESIIKNCVNNGSINCTYYVAPDIEATYCDFVGGIVGDVIESNIYNCINNGNITAYYGVGGISGWTESAEVANCYNKGNVTATGDGTQVGLRAGGIAAYSYYITVSNCVSTGLITGSTEIGAIVGFDDVEESASTCTFENNFYMVGEGQTISAIYDTVDTSAFTVITQTNINDATNTGLQYQLNSWISTNVETYPALKTWAMLKFTRGEEVNNYMLINGMSYNSLGVSSNNGYTVAWYKDSIYQEVLEGTPFNIDETYYTRSGEEGSYVYAEEVDLTEFETGIVYYTHNEFDLNTKLTEDTNLVGGNITLLPPTVLITYKDSELNEVNYATYGKSVTATVTASHKATVSYTYAWYFSSSENGTYTLLNEKTSNSITIDKVSETGYYYVTVSATDGTYSSKANSEVIYLAINKIIVSVPTVERYTYDGTQKNPATTLHSELYTFSGQTSATNFGTYTMTATLNDTVNYCWTGNTNNEKNIEWYIDKAKFVIGTNVNVIATETLDYSGSALKHTLSTTVPNATISYKDANDENAQYTTTAPTYINVGTYSILYKITATNYEDYTSASALVLTINAIPFSQAGCTVSAYNEYYDGNAHSASIRNLPAGTTVTYSSTREGTYSQTPIKYTDVCSNKNVFVKMENSNFITNIVASTISINARPITFVSNTSSNEYTGEEFSAQSSVSSTIGNGLCSGHTFTATNTGKITNVGSINSTVSSASIMDADGNDVTENYNISYVDGTMTITIREITYKINTKSSQYGDEFVALTGEVVAGSISTVSPDILLTKEFGTDLGTYKITGEFHNANYAVTFVGEADGTKSYGAYTITKRVVKVAILKVIAFYTNQEMPLGWKVVEGSIVNDDNLNIVLTRVAGTEVGSYNITGKYNNAKYEVTIVDNTYEIVKSTLAEYVISQKYVFNYDGREHSGEVKMQEGLDSAVITYSSSGGGEYSTDIISFTEIGTHKVFYKIEYGNTFPVYGYFEVVIENPNSSCAGCGTITTFDKTNGTGLFVLTGLIFLTATAVLFIRKKKFN